jgi:hypothetical protein
MSYYLYNDYKIYYEEFAKAYIFEHGNHPAMMSNMDEFIDLCSAFLKQ